MEHDRMTILIVEDDPGNIILLENCLNKPGFKTVVSDDGEDAVKQAGHVRPDLILMDVMMPGIDGFETCRILKSDEKTRDIPVIFLTALSNIKDKIKGFEAGGVDFISKPFQIQEVLARVKTHLTICKLRSQLERANKNLENKVSERATELAEANRELRKAKETAEAESMAKTEFLANLSHELRTHFSPVIGFTELLMATNLDAEQSSFLVNIQGPARRLLKRTDDLIELSRIEAGAVSPSDHVFDPGSLLTSVFGQIAPDARAKHLELKHYINSDVPKLIQGDPDLVQKILIRISENAVKFTEKGEISLKIFKEKQDNIMIWLGFSVQDTGIGISGDYQKKMFPDFSRAGSSKTRQYRGMGLMIVQRMVRLLDGEIRVKSEQGKGTLFEVILPFPYSEG
ncbi:response regulator [Desulfococcaceae bacterium HSG8]|nr:response regulator [Desulfococcaceae bacterium HSG8]